MAQRDSGGDQARGGQGQPSGDYRDQADENELAAQFSELARSLQQEGDLQDTLDGIVTAAVQTVPGVEYAGLTVVRRRRAERLRSRARRAPSSSSMVLGAQSGSHGPLAE
jgi:hypothetical protein